MPKYKIIQYGDSWRIVHIKGERPIDTFKLEKDAEKRLELLTSMGYNNGKK